MANGFLTESPGSRHGDTDTQIASGWCFPQKFTCPGSGAQEISEIGIWCENSGSELRLAIFTDDSGNDCPDVMVSNSESDTLTTEATLTKEYHTYGTKPELTGGVDYWLVPFYDGAINFDHFSTSGIDALSVTGYTPYTWPTGDNWHSHNDRTTYDIGIYAVYAAAGGPSSTPSGSPSATPSEGTPSEGTPSEGTPSEGTPSEGTPSEGTPSATPSATPSEGTPSEGTPSEGTPSATPSEGTPSASPSPGWEGYTKGEYGALPGDDTGLSSDYTEQNYIDVDTDDGTRVGQTADDTNFTIHQFKDFAGTETSCTVTADLQSDYAPSDSTVYLQIYNYDTTTWETKDSEAGEGADTDFVLTFDIADLTNYKSDGIMTCRIYQENA